MNDDDDDDDDDVYDDNNVNDDNDDNDDDDADHVEGDLLFLNTTEFIGGGGDGGQTLVRKSTVAEVKLLCIFA